MGFFGTLIFVLVLLAGLWYLGYALRVPARYMYREYRSKRSHKMRWFHLSPDRSAVRDDDFIRLETNGAAAFAKAISLDARDRVGRFARPVVSFVWVKTENRVALYAGVNSSSGSIIGGLARGIGYRAKPVRRPPKIAEGALSIGHRNYRDNYGNVAVLPNSLGEVAATLSDPSTPDGAVILTVETARNSERGRYALNMAESRLMVQGDTGNFASQTSNAATDSSTDLMRGSIGAIVAGGSDHDSKDLLRHVTSKLTTLASDVNGRDIYAQQRTYAITTTVLFGLVVGLSVWGGALSGATAVIALIPFLAGLAAIMLGVGKGEVYQWALRGELVVPNFWYFSPRYFITGLINSQRTNGKGGRKVGNRIAPPSIAQVIHFYPSPLIEFLSAPVDGVGALDQETERVARAELGHRFTQYGADDIPLGVTYHNNSPVTLPVKALNRGLVAFGAPDSGKSNFLTNMWSAVAAASSNRPGGMTISPIWVETKGSGAYDALEAGEVATGGRGLTRLVEAHNPSSPVRIAMEGRRIGNPTNSVDDVVEDVGRFYGALKYAFGSAIQHRSAEYLQYSLILASMLLPEEVDQVFNSSGEQIVNPKAPNIINAAWRVLGGAAERVPVGDNLMILEDALRNQLASDREAWEKAGRPALSEAEHRENSRVATFINAAQVLNPILKLERNARNDAAAPMNKLTPFQSATVLFDPTDEREDLTCEAMIQSGHPLVLNFGPYQVGEESVRILNDETSRTLASMFFYILWSTTKNVASDWWSMGRAIPVFADEVADLAGDSPDTGDNAFGDALKEGRSRGFSIFSAGQNPMQVPESARVSMLSVRSKVFFQMPDATMAALAAEQLVSNGEITERHITDLPVGVAAARIDSIEGMTPPFSLKTPEAGHWAKMIADSGSPIRALERYRESEEARTAYAI